MPIHKYWRVGLKNSRKAHLTLIAEGRVGPTEFALCGRPLEPRTREFRAAGHRVARRATNARYLRFPMVADVDSRGLSVIADGCPWSMVTKAVTKSADMAWELAASI
jgi:hypothetical protein